MSALAPTLETFFTERLMHQRQASPNTIAAYRDAWRLLLGYAQAEAYLTLCNRSRFRSDHIGGLLAG
jgi:integrase/recombinase XerD